MSDLSLIPDMKISIRALGSVTVLPGLPFLRFDGQPRIASPAVPPTPAKSDIDKKGSPRAVLFDY
jgi:hypothetical protein